MLEATVLARLQAIGLTPQLQRDWATCAPYEAASTDQEPRPRPPLRIIAVQRDSLTLHDGAAELGARALPALVQRLSAAADGLAVGDWVLAERNAFGECWVHDRLPPATQLARRLHDGRDKVTRTVIVSNVDTALLVMGLDNDYSLRRLERYLALVRLSGVAAVVVLTKADLCAAAAERLLAVQALVPADVAAVAVNALSDTPRSVLAPWLSPGQTLVLLGSSGVGKSTLTNALLGAVTQDTGPTRHGDSRGRHTTTARSLHVVPGGACIIDTPGLRTLRLDSEAGSVAGVFDDIATLAQQCRFRDCRHHDEPGCAVQGGVPPERLRSFQKLLREARRDTLTARDHKEQVAVWKARSRVARVNTKAKREGG